MTQVTSIHNALPAVTAGQAPAWVHLIPGGEFRGVDGRGPYRVPDAAALIAASMTRGRLPIDENHATDLAAKHGGAAPARGWIVGLEARADGIWGQVEWTGDGRRLLEDGAYRGISPVIVHSPSGAVGRVLRAGLTNDPNLTLTTLHHQQQDPGMNLEQQIRAALGLPETADGAAIVAAVTGQRDAISAHAAQLSRIATAAGATADAGEAMIITALQARGAGEGELATLRATATALQSQVTTLTNDRARERATAVIEGAMAAGKPIPPALKEHYITRHMADPTSVQTEMDAMVSLHAGGLGGRTVAVAPGGVSADEAAAASFLGLDPAKLRAGKAAA